METKEEAKKEEKKEKKERPKFMHDFGEEFEGSYCLILLPNNETIEGKVLQSRKYFIKVQVKNDVLYINKAFVVYISPLHKKA
jgi:hypothetical protein